MSESNALKVGLVIAAHAPLAGALQQTAKHWGIMIGMR